MSPNSREVRGAQEREIRRAQEIVLRYIPRGRSLVDELLNERRNEELYERRRSAS